MPISVASDCPPIATLLAGGAGRRARAAGFTLLELLVVMVIIAVLAGMTGLALGGNPASELEREARRLQAVLGLAAEEAMIQGQQWGLALGRDEDTGAQRYQFLYFDRKEQRWTEAEARTFRPHALPEDISLDLSLSGQSLDDRAWQRMQQLLTTSGDLRPALLLLSSGETSPFGLTLSHRRADRDLRLVSDGFSGIHLL